MNKFLPFIILVAVFLFIKFGGIGIRLSDSNIYFYTGYQLLQGNILYKDIFFTNFPLLPYLSAFYYTVSFGNLWFYMLTPTLEVILTSFLLYKIVLLKKQSVLTAACTIGVYLFSFIILATSDHQTGVFLASLFATAAYFFFLKKNFIVSGMLVGFMIMTKAYFIPVFIALSLAVILANRKDAFRFFAGFLLSVSIILLPSILFAREDLYKDIVSYSLTRSQGLSKSNILRFFATHDFLFILFFIYSVLRFKKNMFLATLSSVGIVFVLFYKDIYYLYLNFFIPFLALSLTDVSNTLKKRFNLHPYILPTVLIVVSFINIGIYLSGYQQLQRLQNVEEITLLIKRQASTVLYGTNGIAPALAYLSGKTLLNDIIDTNENIYRKGYLNASLLTKDAISQNSILVAKGAYYPQFNIEEPVASEIFDKEQVLESCEVIGSFPITTEGIENRLNILQCEKSADE